MTKYDEEISWWREQRRLGLLPESPDGRCLAHLLLPADYFAGKRVLEVGPGPLKWATDFIDCELTGLDPLTDAYRQAGFELGPMRYVRGYAEDMPFEDDEFDAVISFNAIDHVDDFEKACREIERVCKGVIRVECHYHEAWKCEPMELNDERVRKAFTKGIDKLIERPYGGTFFPGHPESPSYTGTVALWSNDPYLCSP